VKTVIWLEGALIPLCVAAAALYALRTSQIKKATYLLYLLFVVWFIVFCLLIPAFRVWQTSDQRLWDSFCEPGPAIGFLLFAAIYSMIFGAICWVIRFVYRFFKGKPQNA